MIGEVDAIELNVKRGEAGKPSLPQNKKLKVIQLLNKKKELLNKLTPAAVHRMIENGILKVPRTDYRSCHCLK
jgi:hypothetical protein